MGLWETAFVYLLIGLVVGAAFAVFAADLSVADRLIRSAAAVLFWPLFAPIVLARSAEPPAKAATGTVETRVRASAEQLLASLARVDGIAEGVLAPELARIRGLAGSLASMERRVRDMDALLATVEFNPHLAREAGASLRSRGVNPEDPRVRSIEARLRNIDRLRAMRDRTADDLERIVLKLEEMSSQMELLKFAGRCDAEAVRVIKDIADSVQEATDGMLQAE
jgi:hypothetical protein